MRALIDCNNFFVSCERIFNPALNNIPVVVLSGNDGCVIARSNEAKSLGIPMGAPVFKYKTLFEENNVKCFSGNQALYNDISKRIMTILGELVDNLAVYSIDEAFFDYPDCESESFLRDLAFRIQKCVGVPVSIGASRTRTLAKIASHIAKKECTSSTHCYVLNKKEEVHKRLSSTPVGDVWGIGRQMKKTLESYKVITAFDFASLPKSWVKEKFTITGERTWLELHGIDCELGSFLDIPRQSLTFTRTFHHELYDYTILSEALSSFVSSCAAKLRKEKLLAANITIFIAGNRFNIQPQYSNSASFKIYYPTSSTIELVKYTVTLLKSIYKEGCGYKRAGVILSDLKDENNYQIKLFNPINEEKHIKLMKVVDNLNNQHFYNTLHLAADGIKREWRPKKEFKSREYTTSFKDILIVNCK